MYPIQQLQSSYAQNKVNVPVRLQVENRENKHQSWVRAGGDSFCILQSSTGLHPEWGWWGNHQGWELEPSLHLTAGEMWQTKGSFELWIRSWKQRQQIQLIGRALASHKQELGLDPQHYKHRTRIWKWSSTFLKCYFSNHLDVCIVTGAPVSQAGLRLTMHPKMILNFCLWDHRHGQHT